ncbi:Phosphoserine phosphatase [Ophidiomyces ophidiicola]|nr:Phosphoserine phosphatase [Ophidiomyces ophidiicola]
MADAPSSMPLRGGRPILRHSSLTGGSYIRDHQQYSSPPPEPAGVARCLQASPEPQGTAPHVLNASVTRPKDARVQESGIVHTIFRNSLSCLPADTPKLVATIFYKASQPVHPHLHPDAAAAAGLPSPATPLPVAAIPEGSAPSQRVDALPREPPPQEPEPLDHLYGPYVSQLCLTNFLQIMEDLSTPYQRITSSHRCLDHEHHPRVVEVTLCPPPSLEYLSFDDMRKHELIWRFEREWNVEVVLQPESVFRRYKRLAVFDMDSTLIKQEVIDEIARFVGVEKDVSVRRGVSLLSHVSLDADQGVGQEITERAMNGELDFSASLRARVALLKGVPADVFENLKPVITIAPGARELCQALKRLGFKLAVLSGGFQPLAKWLAAELGLDYAYANHLITDDTTQTLTGTLSPDHPIIDATQKRHLLRTLAADNGIPISQTLAVGDGANDLLMLNEAGLGVAWRAKSKVQLDAPTRLNGERLLDILYLLGLSERDIKELTQK